MIAGDSFTIRTAPKTWIESLRDLTGQSILTLGAPSWGPLNETEAIKQYGLDKKPKWVVLMYFEGNDLFNTEEYLERQATGMSWKEYDFSHSTLWDQLIMPHMIQYWCAEDFPQCRCHAAALSLSGDGQHGSGADSHGVEGFPSAADERRL